MFCIHTTPAVMQQMDNVAFSCLLLMANVAVSYCRDGLCRSGLWARCLLTHSRRLWLLSYWILSRSTLRVVARCLRQTLAHYWVIAPGWLTRSAHRLDSTRQSRAIDANRHSPIHCPSALSHSSIVYYWSMISTSAARIAWLRRQQGRSVTQWVWGAPKNIIYSTRGVNRAGPNAGRAGPGRARAEFLNCGPTRPGGPGRA